ncbi:four-carbon acid sugar kinase family protein [Paracoccus aerius]
MAEAPWVTWLGDDFTGSAAVMEVLHFAGLPSVLFTDIPSPELAARFADCRGVGIATTARSHDPAWMVQNLPALFGWLDRLRAPILHYKICSTFDSSPVSGSIGAAIELGLQVRSAKAVPLLTAAPQMRRYQAFGHLFAGTLDGVFRLDRHPVMSRHPVTPMLEADLLRHLAAQTDLPSALIDLEGLADPRALQDALASGAGILSIDSMDPVSETAAGRLLWENRADLGFVAGSQGVEYALVRHWQDSGMIPASIRQALYRALTGSWRCPARSRQLRRGNWTGPGGTALRCCPSMHVPSPAAMPTRRPRRPA